MFYQRRSLAASAQKLYGRTRPDWPLGPTVYLTDARVHPDPEPVLGCLPRGSVVILRDYDHPQRETLAFRLAEACRKRHLNLLVGADDRLAARVGAAGVHLPEGLVGRLPLLRQKYPALFFTTACHSECATIRAERLGADALLLSPVFPTLSHPESFSRPGRTLGPVRLAGLCRRTSLPVYALGGITMANVRRLRHIPLAGIASIRGYGQ
ncbi:thiamine phosphate synthase [Emcibacter sp.]|uniref:thiamine phosphate synthase n=1 Tax=Emcibacter sp. TaxID=1979954 RepID=UPI003A8FDEAA